MTDTSCLYNGSAHSQILYENVQPWQYGIITIETFQYSAYLCDWIHFSIGWNKKSVKIFRKMWKNVEIENPNDSTWKYFVIAWDLTKVTSSLIIIGKRNERKIIG